MEREACQGAAERLTARLWDVSQTAQLQTRHARLASSPVGGPQLDHKSDGKQRLCSLQMLRFGSSHTDLHCNPPNFFRQFRLSVIPV